MRLLSSLLVLFVFSCGTEPNATGVSSERTTYPTVGSIEKFDDRLDDVVDATAPIEQLAEGFTWSEGPVWWDGAVYFSDVPENRVHRWSEADGISVWLEPSGYTGPGIYSNEPGSNGLLLDLDGNLLLCQHGDRRVARFTGDRRQPRPEFETVAGSWRGQRFNSPNDVVQHTSGDLYFTDPPYGLPDQAADTTREIHFQGVFRLHANDTLVTVMDSTLTRPNGVVLSPDGRIAYVANSDPKAALWRTYEVDAAGNFVNPRLFFDATNLVGKDGEPGLPDGMVVHRSGNLFATGPGGVWIFAPDGTALGKIRTGRATANCTLDSEQSALYITADDVLLRVRL